MVTQRGLQFLLLLVAGLTKFAVAEEKGPFGSFYTEGPCIKPEPTAVAKIDENLRSVIRTKGFRIVFCSMTYAGIHHLISHKETGPVNQSNYLTGIFDANKQDFFLQTTYDGSGPSIKEPKIRCEDVKSPSKRKCATFPDKKFGTTLVTVWSDAKYTLDVGCTDDGHKYWVVFGALLPHVYDPVYVDKDTIKIILGQVEKLGFKREMIYQSSLMGIM